MNRSGTEPGKSFDIESCRDPAQMWQKHVVEPNHRLETRALWNKVKQSRPNALEGGTIPLARSAGLFVKHASVRNACASVAVRNVWRFSSYHKPSAFVGVTLLREAPVYLRVTP